VVPAGLLILLARFGLLFFPTALAVADGAVSDYITDDGRAFFGYSQFELALDPNNNGVNLVRRLDYGIPDQVGAVYVDGTYVSDWSTPGGCPGGGWLDATVFLPADLTSGRSQITVRIQFVSSWYDFNEFHYWAHSLVNGQDVLTDTLDVGQPASEAAHNYIINEQNWQGTRTNEYCTGIGACCYIDGSCALTTLSDCSGTWQGPNTTCDPNPCSPSTGACCFPGGGCQVLSPTECAAQNGTYQGDGTDCVPNPCQPSLGACCYANRLCGVLSLADCAAQGGTYQGDGTDCDPNPCDLWTGACCFHPGGGCEILRPTQCADRGGTYQGDGSDCASNPCADDITDDGRAFLGYCQFTVTLDPNNDGVNLVRRLDYGVPDQVGAVYVDGTYVGEWSTPGACPGGAWLDSTMFLPARLTSGRPQITVRVQFVSSWLDWNEFHYWAYSLVEREAVLTDTLDIGQSQSETAHNYIINTSTWCGTRTDDYCPGVGACCYPDGSCAVTALPECSGTWHGPHTTCNPNPCEPATGACCVGPVCVETDTLSECWALGGTWNMGETCPEFICIEYCAAHATTRDEYIDSMQFVTIDNASHAWSPGGYGDYTSLSTDVIPSIDYPISVTVGLCYPGDGVTVYCDWNHNGVLDDPGEVYTLVGPCSLFAGTIAVPANAPVSSTRMRVRLWYDTDPGPCGTDTYGETEDYTLHVLPVGACCFADGTCRLWTAEDCALQGGVYQGDETACMPVNPCPQPTIACCLAGNTCQDLTTADCLAAGGSPQAFPSSCADTSCTNGALHFDGNDYGWVPDNAVFHQIEDNNVVSIEAWIKPEGYPQYWFSIIDKYDAASDFGWTFQRCGLAHSLNFTSGAGNGASVTWDAPPGEWHYVGMTYKASESIIRFYVDGGLFQEMHCSADIQSTGSAPMYIGYNPSAADEYNLGILDELRLWNRVLAPEEIAAHYNVPLTGQEPGLVGYWRLDDGAGMTFADSSPSHLDGQLAGADHTPTWVPGAPLLLLRVGDLNCDGTVGFGDINPFVLALTNPFHYPDYYPDCDIMLADINLDGYVDFADINPFVALLCNP
jgi:hypothetical protein